MRLLTRRIYRAFPELDRFPDEACERFVRAARRGWATTLVHATIVSAVVLPGMLLAFKVYSLAIGALYTFGDPLSLEQPRLLAIAALVGMVIMGLPVIAGLWVRDRILRRRVGLVLRTRGSCNNCRYSLLGLPVDEDLKVVCPECGTVLIVDASLGELSGEGGQNTFVPKAANEGIAPPLFSGRTWRRIYIGAIAVVVVPLLLGLLGWGVFEYWIRQQGRLALLEMERCSSRATERTSRVSQASLDRDQEYSSRLRDVIRTMRVGDAQGWGWSSQIAGFGNNAPAFAVWSGAAAAPINLYNSEQHETRMSQVGPTLAAYREAGLHEALRRSTAFLRAAPLDDPAPGISLSGLSDQYAVHQLPHVLGAMLWEAFLTDSVEQGAISLEAFQQMGRLEFGFWSGIRGRVSYIRDANAVTLRILANSPSRDWIDMLLARLPTSTDRNYLAWREVMHDNKLNYLCSGYTSHATIRTRYGEAIRNRIFHGQWVDSSGMKVEPLRLYLDTIAAIREYEEAAASLDPWARPKFPTTVPTTSNSLRSFLCSEPDQSLAINDFINLQERAIRVMLALERYRILQGNYPDTLDALVPAHLDELPRDPFADRPLSYRRCTPSEREDARPYVLYSVGPDGIDQGAAKDCSGDGFAVFCKTVMYPSSLPGRRAGSNFILNPPPARIPGN